MLLVITTGTVLNPKLPKTNYKLALSALWQYSAPQDFLNIRLQKIPTTLETMNSRMPSVIEMFISGFAGEMLGRT